MRPAAEFTCFDTNCRAGTSPGSRGDSILARLARGVAGLTLKDGRSDVLLLPPAAQVQRSDKDLPRSVQRGDEIIARRRGSAVVAGGSACERGRRASWGAGPPEFRM